MYCRLLLAELATHHTLARLRSVTRVSDDLWLPTYHCESALRESFELAHEKVSRGGVVRRQGCGEQFSPLQGFGNRRSWKFRRACLPEIASEVLISGHFAIDMHFGIQCCNF